MDIGLFSNYVLAGAQDVLTAGIGHATEGASLHTSSLSIPEASQKFLIRLCHASSRPGNTSNIWHSLSARIAGLRICQTFDLPRFPVCGDPRPFPLELAARQPHSRGSAPLCSPWQTAPSLRTAKHACCEIADRHIPFACRLTHTV